jgi:hypothetical protein
MRDMISQLMVVQSQSDTGDINAGMLSASHMMLYTSRIRVSQVLILNDASNIGTSIIGASIQVTIIVECFQRAVAEVE